MIHLGDITKIRGDQIEPVNCITFGSPCQDLSIAGRRAGLAGERSGLFMEAIRIIKEMRAKTNGMYPTFAIWENVPGAFSSNSGEDFRAVLEELARVEQPDASIPRLAGGGQRWKRAGTIIGDGWSLAWRQLDSQYFGVAQRRKRIALILDLGGQRAGEILFERTSLSRHPDPCIPTWKEATGLAANRSAGNDRVVGAGCFCKGDGNTDCGRTKANGAGKGEAEERTSGDKCREATAYSLKIRSGCAGGGKGALVQTEKIGTLSTLQDQTLFQLITEPTFCISGNTVDRKTNQNGTGVRESGAFTVNTVDRHAVAYTLKNSAVFDARGNGDGKIVPTITGDHESRITDYTAVAVDLYNGAVTGDKTASITCRSIGSHSGPQVVEQKTFAEQSYSSFKMEETSGTIKGCGGGTGYGGECLIAEKNCLTPWDSQGRRVYNENGIFPSLQAREKAGGNQQTVLTASSERPMRWIVRRLTPTECERLQGYPDGWTDIGEWTDTKGKKHKPADTPRYKALGNSIALPQWFWIAQKMKQYLPAGATLGSLFDGIGGFPLVWETTYGKGTARWASEIEEFPIAVTKKWFADEESLK